MIEAISAFLVGIVLFIAYSFYSHYNSRDGMPPGPKGLPIIGNLLDLPPKQAWFKFAEWGRQYGDVVGLTVLGQKIVVLNSRKSIDALIQKKSGIYSDRPRLTVAGEWGGFDWAVFCLPYNEEFKSQRRMFAQCLGPKTHKVYEDVLTHGGHVFSKGLLDHPEKFLDHVQLLVGAGITRVVYGHQAKDLDDDFIKNSNMLLGAVERLGALGQHPVDQFPILSHLPYETFGKTFAKTIREMRAYTSLMFNRPYDEAVERMKSHASLKPNMVDTLVESNSTEDGTVKHEYDIKSVVGIAYAAAVDSTMSGVYAFFLQMANHPEVVKKAQKAIDELLGGSRLPTFEDRPNLPYLDAILMEVIRWGTAVPLALPHKLTADDEYNGMKIPAGTTVITNSWAMLHDENDYPDPERFYPERYLHDDDKTFRDDVADPRVPGFGYGRRICPGRYLGESMLWITFAQALATFDISKRVENGKVIEPSTEIESTLIVSHPVPYTAHIVPRSQNAANLLISAIE